MKEGYLAGEVIPFLSNCTWLLGRHMGKADLSYVFVTGADNAVTVEAVKNAQYEPGMPRYFATMVHNTFMRRTVEGSYVGDALDAKTLAFRQLWLKERKIDATFFDKLVKGGVASKSGSENDIPKDVQLKERFSELTKANTDKTREMLSKEMSAAKKSLPSKGVPSKPALKQNFLGHRGMQGSFGREPETTGASSERTALKRNFGNVTGRFGKEPGKSKKAKKTPEETTKSQKTANKEAAFARRCAEQREELKHESLTNPLRNKPVTSRIIMGALSAKGPDDPSLKSLIRNAEDAEMATNLCRYLVAALEHYSQPSSEPSRPDDPSRNSRQGNHIGDLVGHDVHVNPNMSLDRNADSRRSGERHANEVSRLQHEAWQLRAEHEREVERLHAQELRLREDHARRVRQQQNFERSRREECERAQRESLGGGAFAREFQDR